MTDTMVNRISNNNLNTNNANMTLSTTTTGKQLWSPTEVAELTAAVVANTKPPPLINQEKNGPSPPPSLIIDLQKIEAGLKSEESSIQLEAARKLRILLSSERDFLIKHVLEKNWIPKLINWLKLRDRPTLQVEALWALTNIAAAGSNNENSNVLIQNGVIPTLVSLLDSTNVEVLEQSVWVLGNLAGETVSTRDLVLNSGAIPALVKSLQKLDPKKKENISLIRIITWSISNLCDGQPRPVFEIDNVLPELARMLLQSDTEILSHVCWTFSHLCDGPSSHIQSVVNSNVCQFLVELLSHHSWRVTKPALRAIGNIVCAEDDHDYTQHIIECGAVASLRKLIGHSNREIQKEACWTLSNIAAGTIEQIQCVLDSESVPVLIKLASSDKTDSEVRSEACWVILNATSCGSDNQIGYLVSTGCIRVLCNLLEEPSMVMMALEGLERILQVGEEIARKTKHKIVKNNANNTGPKQHIPPSNPYAHLIASKKIEDLEKHKSPPVAKRAGRIWRQHFVTCAICQGAFSKNSNDTFFCAECKCNVCQNCDCNVFHLQYQESLWQKESVKENEKNANKTTKKTKKQKKRQRNKDKKQQSNNGTSNTGISKVSPNGQNKDEESGDEDHLDDDLDDDDSDQDIYRNNYDDHNPQLDKHHKKQIQQNNTSRKNASRNRSKKLDEQLDENDKLVSYLLETGSIMALAQKLDQEDDNSWTIAEEDSKKIHN